MRSLVCEGLLEKFLEVFVANELICCLVNYVSHCLVQIDIKMF